MATLRRGLCLLLFLSVLASPAWTSDATSAARLRWYSADGEMRTEIAIDRLDPAGPERSTTPFEGDRWFIPLPAVNVPLFDGGSYPLRLGGDGKVIILDFWATWCGPCKKELPQLQTLYDELHGQGLEAVAINVEEPLDLAQPWAESLGLTMPLGIYGPEIAEAFPFKKLPLVIVVDKWGKMRARWDGYQQGYEEKIAEFAGNLLAETAPPSELIAQTMTGGDLLEVRWTRETLGKVEGVAFVPGDGDGNDVLASVGRSLVLYGGSGVTVRTWELELTPGLPRSSGPSAGNGYLAVGFRPGSDHLFILRMPEGVVEQATAPSPVFDAAPLDVSSMLLATYDGLLQLSSRGELLKKMEGFEGTAALRLDGEGEKRQAIALELGGRLSWLDPDGRIASRIQTAEDGWRLLAHERAPAGVGTLPMAVTGSTAGSFLEGERAQAALATGDGRLLLIDLDSGELLFEAAWPDISDLAAGDLDGDGKDELAVASGSRITLLSTATP